MASQEIEYSEKYHDDEFEYRHVILPKHISKTAPKGADAVGANLVVLRLWTGKPGQPTVVQFFLPGGGWDGSSNFNFMKELLARYHGEAPTAVFKAGKTVLKAESKATLEVEVRTLRMDKEHADASFEQMEQAAQQARSSAEAAASA